MTPHVPASEMAARFSISGTLLSVQPLRRGLINDSVLLAFQQSHERVRFLMQRINPRVFPRADLVVANIARVTDHVRRKLSDGGAVDTARRALTLIPARDGRLLATDAFGACWRVYRFIEASTWLESPRTPGDAYAAARAFGEFQRWLADLPPPRLHETLPGFHDTPRRLEALFAAARDDPLRRAAQIEPELAAIGERAGDAARVQRMLASGELPERIAHNDAKIGNVLFDSHSGDALCVVDLDTIMPGTALFDFGDLVRSCGATAPEDEPDAGRVRLDRESCGAVLAGFTDGAGDALTAGERAQLWRGAWTICIEQAARFLADHLRGDVYYKISRPLQNLDRARVQLRVAFELEAWRILE